jgi:hypothetical protein
MDAPIGFREARRADLPRVVALLADDALGAAREVPGEPLAAAYQEAFDAMADQVGNVPTPTASTPGSGSSRRTSG